MTAVVGLVIVAVVAGYIAAATHAQSAQSGLEAAQEQTASLLVEQAKYSVVAVDQGKVAGIQASQKTATTTEIDWQSYLRALQKTLPKGATIQSVATTSADQSATSPLDSASVAQVTLTATTKGVPDIVRWIGAFQALPGYAGSTPSVASGDTGYQTTFTINVNEAALAHRFDTEVKK